MKHLLLIISLICGMQGLFAQDLHLSNDNSEAHGKRHVISVNPFSPLRGDFVMGIQRSVTPSRNISAQLGIIGLGFPEFNPGKDRGAFVRLGYRLKLKPSVVTDDMKWSHAFAGTYIEPKITFSVFRGSRNYYEYDPSTQYYNYNERRETHAASAFLIGLGKQLLIGDVATLDLHYAVGYTLFQSDNSSDDAPFNFGSYHSHTGIGRISWQSSLALGILIR